MSVALDFALFMRNSKTKLGLSLATEGVGFKLAFRIGSNTTTWISHESLAFEAGITEANLRKHTHKLARTGIIKMEKNKKDNRKNTYSFVDILLNYHMMNDSQKRKVHEALGDEMIKMPVDNFENSDRKRSVIKKNSDRKRSATTDRKRSVIHKNNQENIIYNQQVKDDQNFPKEKEERNIEKQSNRESSKCSVNLINYPDDFFPDDERRELLSKHARRTNNSEHELLAKFEKVSKDYKTKSSNWQYTLEQFLVREKPKKIYENKNGQMKRYDDQPIYN